MHLSSLLSKMNRSRVSGVTTLMNHFSSPRTNEETEGLAKELVKLHRIEQKILVDNFRKIDSDRRIAFKGILERALVMVAESDPDRFWDLWGMAIGFIGFRAMESLLSKSFDELKRKMDRLLTSTENILYSLNYSTALILTADNVERCMRMVNPERQLVGILPSLDEIRRMDGLESPIV